MPQNGYRHIYCSILSFNITVTDFSIFIFCCAAETDAEKNCLSRFYTEQAVFGFINLIGCSQRLSHELGGSIDDKSHSKKDNDQHLGYSVEGCVHRTVIIGAEEGIATAQSAQPVALGILKHHDHNNKGADKNHYDCADHFDWVHTNTSSLDKIAL